MALTGFVVEVLVIFFFPGLCALSLGFNTENDYVPVGLTSQGINVWIHVPVSQFGSSIC